MDDSYLKTWKAKIVSVKDDKYIILDKTAFYPKGGGQPWDEGFMTKNGEKFRVNEKETFMPKLWGNLMQGCRFSTN